MTTLLKFVYLLFITLTLFFCSSNKKTIDTTFIKDTILELKNFPIYTQVYPYSCNTAAISMVRSFIVSKITESDLRKELKLENYNQGMLPHKYLQYLNTSLSKFGYKVEQVNPSDNYSIIKIIYNSLSNGMPVSFYYSTLNILDKPNFDTHYSVIYGIDTTGNQLKIANSYGFSEEISYEVFFDSLQYKNYKDEPLNHQLGRLFGYIPKNNLFIVTQK